MHGVLNLVWTALSLARIWVAVMIVGCFTGVVDDADVGPGVLIASSLAISVSNLSVQ